MYKCYHIKFKIHSKLRKKKKTSKQSTRISLTTWMVFDQTFNNKIGIKCYLPHRVAMGMKSEYIENARRVSSK